MPFRGHNKSHLLVVYYCLKDFLLPPFCLKQSLMFGFHVGFHTNELQVVGRSWNENLPASHSFFNFLHLSENAAFWLIRNDRKITEVTTKIIINSILFESQNAGNNNYFWASRFQMVNWGSMPPDLLLWKGGGGFTAPFLGITLSAVAYG